jgi:hypothetical protein
MSHNDNIDNKVRNYGTIFWILLPLLLLWWLPLLFASIGNVFRNFRGTREAVEDGVVGGAPVVGYSRTRDLARMARDAFIVLLGGLFLVHIIMGCIDHCVYGAAWSAFAFFLVNYLLTLCGGRFNILAPLWLLGFAASAIALFSCVYRNFDQSLYSGYSGIHD